MLTELDDTYFSIKSHSSEEVNAPCWDFVVEKMLKIEQHKHLYDYHNFFILCFNDKKKNRHDFIQTVFHNHSGGWTLERREWYTCDDWTHFIAKMDNDPVTQELPQIQYLEIVISAFHSFYFNLPWPSGLKWEVYDQFMPEHYKGKTPLPG